MGKKKLGNANAQQNNNQKKGNGTSQGMVEFTTGKNEQIQKKPLD